MTMVLAATSAEVATALSEVGAILFGSSLLVGTGLLTGVISVSVAVLVVAGIIVFAVRFGPWISRAIDSESDEVLLLSIIGVVLLVGGFAEEVQVSAAVGAFLVGLAISGPVQHRAGSLMGPLRHLFAAIFFFLFALGVDSRQLLPVLPVALGLATFTALTKVGVGWWAAGRAGVGVHGRWRAGTMLIPRGEFSIVIAGLGVAAGVGGELGPLAAAYVLILAVAGPLVARTEHAPRWLVRRTGDPAGSSGPTR